MSSVTTIAACPASSTSGASPRPSVSRCTANRTTVPPAPAALAFNCRNSARTSRSPSSTKVTRRAVDHQAGAADVGTDATTSTGRGGPPLAAAAAISRAARRAGLWCARRQHCIQ